VKYHAIPFKGPMVRAIRAGTKTQTRRVVKPEPTSTAGRYRPGDWLQAVHNGHPIKPPHGTVGDRLWVREPWRAPGQWDDTPPRLINPLTEIRYEADLGRPSTETPWGKLRPGMFMPRWACRLELEITGLRVERLGSISEADAAVEGPEPYPNHPGRWLCGHREGLNFPSATAAFRDLWESINGPGSWAANPWVWVYEFKLAPGIVE
jgi:hypothetical protein